MTTTFSTRQTAPSDTILRQMWRDAPAFTALCLFVALACIPLLAAIAVDARQFGGETIWAKPLKFNVAMVIYLASLAFFARYLPPAMLQERKWGMFAKIVCFAILLELVWVGGAATYDTASHFNTTNKVMSLIYPVMGVFAVVLTSATLVMGIAIWRNDATGLSPALRLSIALGLILTFVLTVMAAGTLSSSLSGHLVGTPMTGQRLAIMGWSHEVGDLRVAHFLATHALHALPIFGFVVSRILPRSVATLAVWAGAAAFTALVVGTMLQALAGQPFLPWLG